MSNEFNNLVDDFQRSFDTVVSSKNLIELKNNFIDMEIQRENVFEWVLTKIQDDEEKGEYLSNFANFENKIWTNKFIPEFDEGFDFMKIEEMFEEHSSYFQRYGCLTSDQIISWDKESVLFDDEFGNVEIVKRPDVLLNIQ
jgi:hypothetical protein